MSFCPWLFDGDAAAFGLTVGIVFFILVVVETARGTGMLGSILISSRQRDEVLFFGTCFFLASVDSKTPHGNPNVQ